MIRTYRILYWDPRQASSPSFSVDARAQRPAGLPTVFTDDQRPAADINRWLLSLASNSPSASTWRTYAREVVRFAEHLHATYGIGLLDQELLLDGEEVIRTYQGVCVRADEQDSSARPVGDAKTTLGKRRSAITSFYRWAERTKGLDFPFDTVPVQTRRGVVHVVAGLRGGRRTAAEREPIPGEQLERFHRVGLLGELPGGGVDPSLGASWRLCRSMR